MAMKLRSYIFLFTVSFLTLVANTTLAADTWSSAESTEAGTYLVRFSGFLSNVLLPTVFSLAFLFFIYNTARYYIIDASNQLDRAKAKNQALYSIAAFVFLVSLWAIVNLIAGSFNLNNTETCPDYYKIFNKSCGTPISANSDSTSGGFSSVSSNSGSYTGGSNSYSGGTGDYSSGSDSYSGGTDSYSGGSSAYGASLAELIFGTGKDGAGYHRSLIESAALATTPIIPDTTSCEAGFQTLMLAARTETAQSAYAYYKTSTGADRWKNITDRSNTNYIGYDRDILDELLGSDSRELYIIHVHPDTRVDALGLTATGHGPSAADMALVCQLNDPTLTYLTVDETGVWALTQSTVTCPMSATTTTDLATIETFADLAILEASTRADELAKYLADSLTPAAQKTTFGALDAATLPSLSLEEILALSDTNQVNAGITLTHFDDVTEFCSTH